jgi:outer membrane receptor protein involved in Fe transport
MGRWVYTLGGSYFDQRRQTCNFFQGVCLRDKFQDINFDGRWVAPGISLGPTRGTDEFFGGERLKTIATRADVSGQVTDHHQLQFGAFYQRHDLEFNEIRNLGINDVIVVPSGYKGTPWDGAVYLQDRIEYDFITIKLGARFDFGRAGGLFFTNPQDPTNGTRADDVCRGEVFASAPFTYTYTDPTTGQQTTYTGFDACTQQRTLEGSSALLDSAAVLAQQDDFTESRNRTQFSPRIGVSFPLSERSQVFFNFGRYSQNPLYNNLYTNTGIGTVAGDEQGICGEDETKVLPGTTTPSDECYPIIAPTTGQVSFFGNPNLLIEKTTSYEVGYATELGRDYALQVTLFNKDQYGLSGVALGGVDSAGNQIFDPGTTYGTALPGYSVLLNRDFATVRGFEVALRRRLANYWAFNINYSYSQATTNAAPPDREFQSTIEEGDPAALGEIRSEIDQPHVFNASLVFRVANEDVTAMPWLNAILRNGFASVTFQAASGLPYTPTTSFTGFGDDQLERNSGRAPATARLDAQVEKGFAASGMLFSAFVRGTNLLNAKGCVQVYTTTGRCDVGSIDQSRARQGNTVGENSPTTFYDRPQYFQAGRSILAGVRVSF